MRTWSLFSDGSSLTPALRPLPGFSSIKAEAGVWLVHNPVTLGHLLKELRYVIVRSLSNRHRSNHCHARIGCCSVAISDPWPQQGRTSKESQHREAVSRRQCVSPGVHLANLEGDDATDEASQIRRQWAERIIEPARAAGIRAPTLELVRTPYREFTTPLLKYIEVINSRYPNRLLAVMIPEIVEKYWWNALLHSRRASRLRSALRARQDIRVIVIDLPWFIKE